MSKVLKIGSLFLVGGLFVVSNLPTIALADSYKCYFVEQCSFPAESCGLSGMRLEFAKESVHTLVENDGNMEILISPEPNSFGFLTVFSDGRALFSRHRAPEGAPTSATVFSRACQNS